MGKIFGKCANCGLTTVGGTQEDGKSFCSKECREFFQAPKFCDQCVAETTQESLGGTFTINVLFGTRLMTWGSEACPRCYSRIGRTWLWILLPLFPVTGQYRVKYQTRKRYYSRKMKI